MGRRGGVQQLYVRRLDTVAQALTNGHWDDVTGAGQFAVAAPGTLAWVAGPVAPYPDKAPVTVDRRGQVARIPAAPVRSYGPSVRLSPDGRQLVMVIFTLTERAVWIYDLSRETLRKLTPDGEAYGLAWFPDGRRVAFGWLKDGQRFYLMQSQTRPPRPVVTHINLILNWFDELKTKVPTT